MVDSRRNLIVALVILLPFTTANAQQQPSPKVIQITDRDVDGNVTTIRTKMKHDAENRRVANEVLDGQEKVIATERFAYDQQGRLREREYRLPTSQTLKWKWTNFRYDKQGQPIRNDIVNGKSKKLGWYVWKYDKDQKLQRRERFNADGSLRFYYGDIKFDPQGEFANWTKFDAHDKKLGEKQWKFSRPK